MKLTTKKGNFRSSAIKHFSNILQTSLFQGHFRIAASTMRAYLLLFSWHIFFCKKQHSSFIPIFIATQTFITFNTVTFWSKTGGSNISSGYSNKVSFGEMRNTSTIASFGYWFSNDSHKVSYIKNISILVVLKVKRYEEVLDSNY